MLRLAETPVSGPSFAAVGNDKFVHSGGTLNAITGMFDGQEILLWATATLTIQPDWTDSGGRGQTRLIGNGNAELVLNAGGVVGLYKTPGGGVAITSIAQVQ
jgi:hypothetical protein